jgi:hypothetical protein
MIKSNKLQKYIYKESSRSNEADQLDNFTPVRVGRSSKNFEGRS